MESETEYMLTRRPAEAPGNAGVPPAAASDNATEVMEEQENIANVDTCIHQAAKALRTGRESIARSFFAQKPADYGNAGSDPRHLLKTGRQRVLDQMNGQPTTMSLETAENSATLQDLNRQLGDQLAKLTADVTDGRTRPEVFKVQVRASLDTYRNSVERLFTRITINVR